MRGRRDGKQTIGGAVVTDQARIADERATAAEQAEPAALLLLPTLVVVDRGEQRFVLGRLGVGGGYAWYSRKTSYSGFFEPRKTQSEWRLFGTWAFL